MEKQTQAQIKAAIELKIFDIVRILHNGERVELIPTKDGVNVIRVRLEKIN